MTSQRNTFVRQAEVRRNLDRLVNPGIQANLVGRTNQNTGVVKAGTRQIGATSFVADVEIQTRFNGATVTIPSVRFNVPVSEGDVVSLEIVGGHPLNGVFGTPIRPKGPNILAFDGPTTATGWADDEAAPAAQKTTNTLYEAYVIPINTFSAARVNTPFASSEITEDLLTLPDTFDVLTIPTAAIVEVSALLQGGLSIVGGPRAGNYSIRLPAARLSVYGDHLDPNGSRIFSRAYTHNGIESARGVGAAVGNYTNRLNSPLISTGNSILFERTTVINPAVAGGFFTMRLSATVPSYTTIELYRQITHPEHPSSMGHPEHPEYSFWTWEPLEAPAANETYYLWAGLSDVEITIVELGTGGSR